jgi:uncharacterized protein YndB with AHSA1/START domain
MPATENQTELRLTHRFDAPRERVFDAWTDPELLRRWWAAGPDWDTPSAEVDLRQGGRYRLSMRNPETGDVHTVVGEYTEISRPERLVYTWAWEDMAGDDGAESLVTVEFGDQGVATEVVVIQSGLTSDESRTNHEHGWRGVLSNLESRVFPPKRA